MTSETQDDTVLSGDPLLDCLSLLCGYFGKARSPESLKAGLAWDKKGMGPELFCTAARRTGFNAKIAKKSDIRKFPPQSCRA